MLFIFCHLLRVFQRVYRGFYCGKCQFKSCHYTKNDGYAEKADLIEIRRGVGGASLKRPAEDITLLDVYRAVDVIEDEELFNFHQPVIACRIGQAMDTRLRKELKEAQSALEHHLKQVTIKQLLIEAK